MIAISTAMVREPHDTSPRSGQQAARLLAELRTQVWYKALDAVVTAPARPASTLAATLRSVFSFGEANYDRVGALVTVVDHLLPGAARRLGGLLLQPNALSLRFDRCELLAYGSGGTVFLLTRGREQRTLKIYRRSLGLPVVRIALLAAEFRQKCALVSAWYNDGEVQLVVPSQFLVLHSPLRRAPALASVQRYIPWPHRDLFADFSAEEILGLAAEDAAFAHQLAHFVAITLRLYEEEERCLDFVGDENVLVVPAAGGHQLLIHDYGVFDLATLAHDAPATLAQVEERMAWLRALQPLLASVAPGETH
jgi:hypothetical protein